MLLYLRKYIVYVYNSVLWNNMWQSRVEIESYSVAYFDCVTAFEAL